jgi:hypothetical protein
VIGAVWNGAQGTVMLATPVYCAVMAVMAREALTEMEAEFSELWTCLWPIMAATVLMAMTVLLVQQFALAERPDPPLVRLLFLSASGAIVYGATLFAIGSPVINEGAEVLGWILGRRRGRQLTLAGQIRQWARVLNAPSLWWACLIIIS